MQQRGNNRDPRRREMNVFVDNGRCHSAAAGLFAVQERTLVILLRVEEVQRDRFDRDQPVGHRSPMGWTALKARRDIIIFN
jgi:hypothetical protein